jgi:haloalkane dehalogenase
MKVLACEPTWSPGADGRPHTTITRAGHFLHEDKGPELARIVVDSIASTNAVRS